MDRLRKKKKLLGVEREASIVRKKVNIQKILLGTIATAGILSLALLAPNALQILRILDGGKTRRKNPKYIFGTAFEKLLEKDFIRIDKTTKGKFVRLTESGKNALGEMIARQPDQRKHVRWDGRWRVVIYDIHDSRKTTRQKLMRTIREFGFVRLQDSVWVYPYDSEALLILLKSYLKTGREILYMVVEKIEGDETLKKHFELP